MLLATLLTFICFFGVQTVSYLIDESPLPINLALEEESESNKNEESEIKVELRSTDQFPLIFKSDLTKAIAYQNNLFVFSTSHLEVATPPPKT